MSLVLIICLAELAPVTFLQYPLSKTAVLPPETPPPHHHQHHHHHHHCRQVWKYFMRKTLSKMSFGVQNDAFSWTPFPKLQVLGLSFPLVVFPWWILGFLESLNHDSPDCCQVPRQMARVHTCTAGVRRFITSFLKFFCNFGNGLLFTFGVSH